MTAYAVPYVMRLICCFFLLLAVYGNGVLLVAAIYLQTGRKRMLWALSRAALLVGLALLAAELVLCQLYLWEGTILQLPLFIRWALIPGLLMAAYGAFAFEDRVFLKLSTLAMAVSYLMYIWLEAYFYLALLGLSMAAFIECGYCLYLFWFEYQGASVSSLLTGLAHYIPHGVAVYGKPGLIIEHNPVYETFCRNGAIQFKDLAALCNSLGLKTSFEGRISYICEEQQYEISIEKLPNGNKAVLIRDITAYCQTLASERISIANLAEQNRIMAGLIRQQEQTELLQVRKHTLHDLHDNAGQMLAVVSMSLELQLAAGSHQNAGISLDRTISILENYTRHSSRDMFYPLRDSLHRLKTIYDAFGIKIMECNLPPPLGRGEEEAVSAICHEALLNAIRHAGATNITVTWNPQPSILVMIENQTEVNSFNPGIGIAGMKARAQRAGMELEIRIEQGCFILSVMKIK